jgi:endonuclease/exonuclease/phosphatase family metal-dependent hydrolase
VRRFRIVTYNVHRCRGLDGRVRPDRIAAVLRPIEADVVALQEVLSYSGRKRQDDQARFLAEELEMHHELGTNRRVDGGAYGNVLLSRGRLEGACNFDLTVKGREERGCLRADVHLGPDTVLHVFNVHLGTSYFERRRQGRRLVEEVIGVRNGPAGAVVVLGDFNEWTPGLTSRLLSERLNGVDVRTHLKRGRTYPGMFPLLHLDHIYFDDLLELEVLTLIRTRLALIASDHLPLVAEFRLT